jgi:multidrug transporter EmrE-like cation transporter
MCYFLLIKKLKNKEDILINSIYWDFMLIFIGYLIPLFIFQFKFNINQIIGLTLVVIGILIIKLFHVPL